jgi:hypothetical protein
VFPLDITDFAQLNILDTHTHDYLLQSQHF